MIELDGVNEGMITIEPPDLDKEVRITITEFQSEQVYLTMEQCVQIRDYLNELTQHKK